MSSSTVKQSTPNGPRLTSQGIGKLFYSDLLPLCQDATGNAQTHEFLQRLVDILVDFIKATNDREEKLLEFRHPQQLLQSVDLSLPDGLRDAKNLEQVLNDCRDTLKHQVKTGHPRFLNQLSNGLDIISMAGEWLTATANTNMFTYEIAPVFILMEHVTLKKMREIIGFKDGDSILAPGGTISNLYSLLAARYKKFPQIKSEGLKAVPAQLVMFTSEHSHFSMMSAAAVSGLGTNNCIEVPCDARGKMIPAELERLILKAKAEGKIPFYVNATAGTTVYGAFDPLNAIADIAEKYGLWMHVDAAWGGGFLVSSKLRHPRFDGVERADSVTWNPHKLLNIVLQCSTVHFKEPNLLFQCNQMCADYLFQQDKHYDVTYDTGDKVIQCGRHNDIFKFWLAWRAKSTEGFGKQMDHFMDLNMYLTQKLRDQPDKFQLIVPEPECTNTCFWYIPKRLRIMPPGPERDQELGKVTPILKGRMMQSGTLMISYQPQGAIPNFFRNIISNQAVTKADLDFLIHELDRLGQDL